MRNAGLGDVGLIGRVVKDEHAVFAGILYPGPELVGLQDRARGVVGIAEVYHVHTMVGYLRYEVVLSRARHVVHVAPASVRERSGASAHHVGVYIHGIDGVGHAYAVVPSHNLPNVSGVALGAVVHEYLVQVGSHPARDEVTIASRRKSYPCSGP